MDRIKKRKTFSPRIGIDRNAEREEE